MVNDKIEAKFDMSAIVLDGEITFIVYFKNGTAYFPESNFNSLINHLKIITKKENSNENN